MAHIVRFVIPAKREFIGLVRLAIGGLAPAILADAETVEDIKLVMSEICTHVVTSVPSEVSELVFTFTLDDAEIIIDIESGVDAVKELISEEQSAWARSKQPPYGLSIVTALMDKVDLVSSASDKPILRLKKFIQLPI